MTKLLNNTTPVERNGLGEGRHIVLSGTKVLEVIIHSPYATTVREVVDIEYLDGKCSPAMRPYSQIAALAAYIQPHLRQTPEGISVRWVDNPGKYGTHPAVAIEETITVPGAGSFKVETKRYRLDSAVWNYECPTWLLPYLAAENGQISEENIHPIYKIEMDDEQDVPVRGERQVRGERPPRATRPPRAPRRLPTPEEEGAN